MNQTEFIRTNITEEETSSFFSSLPSLPSLSQISEYKIPLICAGGALIIILILGIGGALIIILILGIGIKIAANRGTNRPTGDVNVNVNTTNSANNENKTDNSVSNENNPSPTAPEVAPQPPFNYPGMDLEAILKMKPNERSSEEQDLVLLHIREKKEEEASRQN